MQGNFQESLSSLHERCAMTAMCTFCGAVPRFGAHGVALCWPCLHRLGRLLGVMEPSVKGRIWDIRRRGRRKSSGSLSADESEIFDRLSRDSAALSGLSVAQRVNALGVLSVLF